MACSILGLDIGGANLKAAHVDGPAVTQPFALWKNPRGLTGALRRLVAELPPADVLAITMTGELCDCFATKREGVHTILQAVTDVAGQCPVHVWSVEGRFLNLAEARERPLAVAAANWLGLASYAARFASGPLACVVDIGSTTTDLTPMRRGQPSAIGRDDPERLASGALLYRGVKRTPVFALASALQFRGRQTGLAAEVFATTYDVHLLLGDLSEARADDATADGRPATREYAQARLLRMVGADTDLANAADALDLARQLADLQVEQTRRSLAGLIPKPGDGPPITFILAGEGEFLARRVIAPWLEQGSRSVALSEQLGAERSQAACAHAVGCLAAEAGSS